MNLKLAESVCILTKQSVGRFLPNVRSMSHLPATGDRINYSKIVARRYGKSSTASKTSLSKTECLACLRSSLAECPKITLPGCRKVRSSTKCVKFSSPPDCQPIRAPYSSYHECGNKKPTRTADLDDCRCFGKVKTCGQRQLF